MIYINLEGHVKPGNEAIVWLLVRTNSLAWYMYIHVHVGVVVQYMYVLARLKLQHRTCNKRVSLTVG